MFINIGIIWISIFQNIKNTKGSSNNLLLRTMMQLNILRNILSNIIIKIERKGGIAYGNNQTRF